MCDCYGPKRSFFPAVIRSEVEGAVAEVIGSAAGFFDSASLHSE